MTYIFNRKHRDRLDIFSEILEIGNGNKVRIGNISNKSGLPYYLLKEYSRLLLQNNLLEYQKEEKPIKQLAKASIFLDFIII
jgi:predicted transcriptional regulator